MPKSTANFKENARNHLLKASQRQTGEDLSGKIIVDYAIFKFLIDALSHEDLERLLIEHPMPPASSRLGDVSDWCALYFEIVQSIDGDIRNQTDFGDAVGLSQSDVSSLLNARKGFYFGDDRIDSLFGTIKKIVSKPVQKAS